jgi:hypothetical protein
MSLFSMGLRHSHTAGRELIKQNPQALMIRTWGEKKARGEFWVLSIEIKTNFLTLSIV